MRDNLHTEKKYTHRKILCMHGKITIILWVYIKRTEKRNTHRIKETHTLILT